MPISVMAGILAEFEAATLRVPGRDPRSTMNAIYHEASVKCMLQMAQVMWASELYLGIRSEP